MQTLTLFVGEAAVMVIYLYQVYRERHKKAMENISPMAHNETQQHHLMAKQYHHHRQPQRESKVFIFWILAIIDSIATMILYSGLLFISASVYQMLRGSVVIFTSIFSYFFLNRRLRLFEWFSLGMIVSGVAVVGLSSLIFPQFKPSDNTANNIDNDSDNQSFPVMSLIGIVLILAAQIFTACQFVIEEKVLSQYRVTPVKIVGMEGTFGLVSALGVLPLIHVLLSDYHTSFDMEQSFHDFFASPSVWKAGIANAITIAFFNWCGLTITSRICATTRSTIDICRTLFIWMVSLYLGWEQFSWIQVIGFVIMVTGTFYFNGVISYPFSLDQELAQIENERAS
ncbi:hypothetical protein BDA99DRAFT_593171, partial [Phascolomyces articulosus]